MNSIELFAVEHCYDDEYGTYEIFESMEQTLSFCDELIKNSNKNKPLFIFSAIFNKDFIYKENGRLNYEDCSELIIKYQKTLKVFNW